jgi:hypothetical protein
VGSFCSKIQETANREPSDDTTGLPRILQFPPTFPFLPQHQYCLSAVRPLVDYRTSPSLSHHSNMLLSILFAFLLGLVSAIPTISTKGSKFFTSDGNQFFLKGMLDDTSALPHHS